MIDQLKQHEKTFAKFVEWMGNQQIGNDSVGLWVNEFYTKTPIGFHRKVSDRELLSLLVEFCDSEGYYMTITLNMFFMFDYRMTTIPELHLPYFISEYDYNTRTEATKAAIVKVFELMEKGK